MICIFVEFLGVLSIASIVSILKETILNVIILTLFLVQQIKTLPLKLKKKTLKTKQKTKNMAFSLYLSNNTTWPMVAAVRM